MRDGSKEEIVKTISKALRDANPCAELIARISEEQFAVVDAADNEKELEDRISQASGGFFRDIYRKLQAGNC